MSTDASNAPINLKVKCTDGSNLDIKLSKNTTILNFKEECSKKVNIPAKNIKLIFKGRLLVDNQKLENYEIENDSIVVLYGGSTLKPKTTKTNPVTSPLIGSSPSPAPSGLNSSIPNPNVPPPNNYPPFTDSANMFGSMASNPMMQNMMNNPQEMIRMAQNPAVRGIMLNLMSNPSMIRQMTESNPALRSMLESNPQLNEQMQRVLDNPQILSSFMSAFNPPQSGTAPNPPTNPNMNTNPPNTNTNPSGNQGNPADYSRFMEFLNMSSPQSQPAQANPPATQNNPTSPLPTQNPRDRFRDQLSQLEAMGFTDKDKNLRHLTETNGNINATIEKLLQN